MEVEEIDWLAAPEGTTHYATIDYPDTCCWERHLMGESFYASFIGNWIRMDAREVIEGDRVQRPLEPSPTKDIQSQVAILKRALAEAQAALAAIEEAL